MCISNQVAIIAERWLIEEGPGEREPDRPQEAETNFDMAQQAVEDYLTNVSENTLLKEQDALDNRGLRACRLLGGAPGHLTSNSPHSEKTPAASQTTGKSVFSGRPVARRSASMSRRSASSPLGPGHLGATRPC